MSYNKRNNKYVTAYCRAHYDTLIIRLPAGRKQAVERFSVNRGQSVNALINELLRVALGLSESEWAGRGDDDGDNNDSSEIRNN